MDLAAVGIGFGFGLTFLRRAVFHSGFNLPLFQLEHILVSDDLTPVQTWINPDGESDHPPVIAALAWDPESRRDAASNNLTAWLHPYLPKRGRNFLELRQPILQHRCNCNRINNDPVLLCGP